jgi:hypothetical protein
MMVFLLTVVGIAVAMVAMALGVMLTGRRLKGSCGGVAGGACLCAREGVDRRVCPRKGPARARASAPPGARSLDVLPD